MLLHLEIIKVIFSLTGFFLCPLLLLLHVCVQTSSLTGCLSLFDCLLLFFIQSGSFGVYLGTTPRLFYESLFFSMSFCICLATTLHCLCVFSFFLCPFTVYHLIISVISYVYLTTSLHCHSVFSYTSTVCHLILSALVFIFTPLYIS